MWQLIQIGDAEELPTGDDKLVVFPTRQGLERAAKLSSKKAEIDNIRSILGRRDWELTLGDRRTLIGIFFSKSTLSNLVTQLQSVADEQQLSRWHLETVGGVVPPSLAPELKGEPLPWAPGFELIQVPNGFSDVVDIARRYRFIVEINARNNEVMLYQEVGRISRWLGGPIPLTDLLSTTQQELAAINNSEPIENSVEQAFSVERSK